MDIRDLNGKSVAILGAYGREGVAMQEALKQYAPEAELELRDMKDGPDYLDNLEGFDCVIKAPGIPPSEKFDGLSTLTNSTQIFLDSIDQGALVIGITGSKGKSTTASLIHAILKEAGKDAILLGNIGDAAIAHIDEVTSDTIVVMEMSSFQLMQTTRSPKIAVITSFFPEHLDYHGDLDSYRDAKKAICKYQKPEDTTFFFKQSEGATDIASVSPGRKIAYEETDSPIAIIDTNLIGAHNLFNIAGAAVVARHLGIEDSIIIEATKKFEGLPHRLKDLGRHHGFHWVDDAISTTPESTTAAIHALSPQVKTLIAGGQDRGNDFKGLGEVIDASEIDHVILMGESGPRIAEAVSRAKTHAVESIEEAVTIAKDVTPDGALCLLSPASPSFGMFKDYVEKGEAYAKEITS